MRVFVVGASGAIGRRLVPQLIERGHEVVGSDRTHADPGKRNPEERARRRILGPCDRWLSTVE